MSRLGIPALIAALFGVLAIQFALSQSIWVDETTQLSGLGLPFRDQLDWLLGRSDLGLGVPPDRMPPLSYWLGGLWSAVFGLSENAMRLFGIVAVLGAVPAVYLAARRVGTGRSAVFALAFTFLSPGTISAAGEIRSYPLFLFFACWAVWAYVELLHDEGPGERRHLLALAIFSLGAIYSHFFGVVQAGLLWTSLFLFYLVEGRRLRSLLIAALVVAILSAGIFPFVASALEVSGRKEDVVQTSPVGALLDLARLLYRIILHGSHMAQPVVFGAAIASMVGLGLIVLLLMARGGPEALRRRIVFLCLPIILAVIVLLILKLAVASFNVLSPNYNIWMLPLFAIILSTAVLERQFGRVAAGFGIVLVLSNLAASWILVRHASLYSHGPGEWVASAIEDPARTLIVHDGRGQWGHVYFPVFFLEQGEVVQVLRRPGEADRLITPEGLRPAPVWPEGRFDRILYVSVQNLTSSQLARRLREPGDCGIKPMLPPGETGGEVRSYCAYAAATMVIDTQ